ncbi:protein FAM151B isoform X3 [Gambusia affinis]|uniref:protein FAM151B isoform X3 n=1 Tax=Gambusia affinis TaxID=33528 RepID=UPI001CDBA1AE|nr:protein FAM151B isoform X3 [Gambusia affinis]
MWDTTLQYFRSRSLLTGSDAVQLKWSHAVNSRNALVQALSGPSHMIEADVIIRDHDPMEPIMAHPPDTDSDITLKEWLEKVKMTSKGIKLDFKSLEAVSPSLALLEDLLAEPERPLWINADILSGPSGRTAPVDFQAFLSLVSSLPAQTVLSLGWTTGWTVGTNNPGEISRTLLQLGHGACHGGEEQRSETSCYLPGSCCAAGSVLLPAIMAAATVRQVHAHSVDRPA